MNTYQPNNQTTHTNFLKESERNSEFGNKKSADSSLQRIVVKVKNQPGRIEPFIQTGTSMNDLSEED